MADFIEPLYKKGKYLYPYTQLNFTSLLQQNGIFETLRTKFRHFETLYRMFWHDPHTKIDFHSLSMLLNGIALRNQSFRNLTAVSDSRGVQDFFLQIIVRGGLLLIESRKN